MSTVRIQCLDTRGAGAVVETWQHGAAGRPDALVDQCVLGGAGNSVDLTVSATQFLVVRDPADPGKSIDNWSRTPVAPPGA